MENFPNDKTSSKFKQVDEMSERKVELNLIENYDTCENYPIVDNTM